MSVSAITGGRVLESAYDPDISGSGRYATFISKSPDLVVGDANAAYDVFLYDRKKGETEILSVANDGSNAKGFITDEAGPLPGSFDASISASGRYVSFSSNASNLVDGDTNGHTDVFVRDRRRGRTILVSLSSDGDQGDGASGIVKTLGTSDKIDANGRYVIFKSRASNLDPDDKNGPEPSLFMHALPSDHLRSEVSGHGSRTLKTGIGRGTDQRQADRGHGR